MKAPLHIISACVIAGNTVLKNDEVFFSTVTSGIQSFLLQLYQYIKKDYPKFYKMDNLSKLGWLASEILIKDKAYIQQFKPEEVAVVISNANSSLDADVKYFQTIDMASPALFVYTLPNILIGEICIRNNFKGENACFVSEDFNANFINAYVEDMFAANKTALCICGWVDVLNECYKAALFLVGKDQQASFKDFSEESMKNIFKSLPSNE